MEKTLLLNHKKDTAKEWCIPSCNMPSGQWCHFPVQALSVYLQQLLTIWASHAWICFHKIIWCFGYTTCFEWFNSEVKMFTHHCMYLTLCFISLDKHSGNFQTVICGVNCSLHTQLYKINDSTLRSWFSKQHEHWHLLVTVFIEYFQILDGVRLFVRNRSMSLRDFSPSKWPNVARPQPSDRQQRRKGRKLGRSFWKYEELLQLHRTSFFFSRTELMLPLCWHKPPRILVGKRGKQKNPFRLATVGCVSCVWCNMVGNVRATFILALMKPVQNTVDLSHLMPK